MPPPSAFLIMRGVEVPVVQGEKNSVFLCYSVADCIFSRGCPQPCLEASQQFRGGLVLPRVGVTRLLQRWYSREKLRKTSSAKAFDTAWKSHVFFIL